MMVSCLQLYGLLKLYIHAAVNCRGKPQSSLRVIQRLLEIYPESISQPEDTTTSTRFWVRDPDGGDQELFIPTPDEEQREKAFPDPKNRTPVFLACSKSQLNPKLVDLLIEKDPTCLLMNEGSSLPPLLHYCCQQRIATKPMLDLVRFVARKSPRAITTRDQRGNYPCHYLTRDCSSLDLIKEMLPSKEMALNEVTGNHLLHLVASQAHFPKHRMKVVEWILKEFPNAIRSYTKQGELPLHKSLSTDFLHTFRPLPMALAKADPFTVIMGPNKTVLDLFEQKLESFEEEIAKVQAETNFDDQDDYMGPHLEQLQREQDEVRKAYGEMLKVFPKALVILFDLLREGFEKNIRETKEHHRSLPNEVILGIASFLFPANAQDVLEETITKEG